MDTDKFVKETLTRVNTIRIELGNECSLQLESSVFGGTCWMLEFPGGSGTQINDEVATALINAVNGENTKLNFDEYFMSDEEAEELRLRDA